MLDDMQYEIMLRTPAEELTRFKTVSKFWYHLISSPKFQLAHFSKSCRNTILLKRDLGSGPDDFKSEFTFYSNPLDFSVPSFDSEFPYTDEHDHKVDAIDERDNEDTGFKFHGHSHGLVCVSDLFGRIYVWNPITTEIRLLPPSCIPDQVQTISSIGFGYDQESKQFKIVRVKVSLDDRYPHLAEIFELSTDKWRPISCNGFQLVFWNQSTEMHFNGTCYWLADELDDQNDLLALVLLSFDLSEEVFAHFPLPDSFWTHDCNCLATGFLNESLILFHFPITICATDIGFDVWKMEKDNFGVTWSKLFTLDPSIGIKKPLAFFSSDLLLMEEDNEGPVGSNEGRIVLYSLKTNEVKKILFGGNPLLRCITTTVFKPSLFSTIGNVMLI